MFIGLKAWKNVQNDRTYSSSSSDSGSKGGSSETRFGRNLGLGNREKS